MDTRPYDPRRSSRRGSTDSSDSGHTVAVDYDLPAVVRGKRWPAPSDIYAINRMTRQRAATGRCVVCGSPTDAAGVTCKALACVRCWVLGHE